VILGVVGLLLAVIFLPLAVSAANTASCTLTTTADPARGERPSPQTTRLTIRSGTATTLRGDRPASTSTTRG